MGTEPIATYSEHLLQVKRVFQLFPDRVEVHARWRLSGREYRNTVKLATLEPEPREMKIRYHWYRYATWVFAAGFLTLAINVYNTQPHGVTTLGWVGMGVAIIGLALALMLRRRVVFARFASTSGRGGLDLAKSGPERGQFDAFIRQVGREIRRQGKKS